MADADFVFPSIEGLEITGLLGKGASSRVYLGIQTRFDRPVAVKVLDLRGRQSLAADMVLNETRVLAMLSAHPNILTLFDAGLTDDGHPYLMTEYLPAGSLGPRLRGKGPLDPSEVVRLGVQLCGALQTAHLHDVIHGDVKPDNVLIGRIGQPLLGDFGVAAMQSRSMPTQPTVLTPLHAAPELLDDAPISVATDVYGLGSTLMALCTGSSPVGGAGERTDVILGRLHDGLRVERGREDVSPALLDLLDRCTARDPADRFAEVSEIGERLRDLQVFEGEAPTEMHVMSEIPGPGTPPELEALSAPDAELTVPPTEDPREVRSSPRLLRTSLGAAAAVVVVGLGAWITVAIAGSSEQGSDGSGPEQTDNRTENGDQGAPSTTAAPGPPTTLDLPESTLAGIQPGVQYNEPPGPDQSAALQETLSEEAILFGQLPSPAVPSDFYGRILHSLPATFRYQAFNPNEPDDDSVCAGMMSRLLTVTALWERIAIWPNGALAVSVAQTPSEEIAHELVAVLSLDGGVDPEECWGFAYWNITDYDDYGVEHRDIDGLLADGISYNLWRGEDVTVGAEEWAQTTRMIMQLDEYVIDISLGTKQTLSAGDEHVVANLAKQIITRLQT